MKMTLLGNSEKTSPPPSPAKNVSEDDVLQAFGLNSAEYTHSCANLAHDEVGGIGGPCVVSRFCKLREPQKMIGSEVLWGRKR